MRREAKEVEDAQHERIKKVTNIIFPLRCITNYLQDKEADRVAGEQMCAAMMSAGCGAKRRKKTSTASDTSGKENVPLDASASAINTPRSQDFETHSRDDSASISLTSSLNDAKRRRVIPPRSGRSTEAIALIKEEREANGHFRTEVLSINQNALDLQRRGVEAQERASAAQERASAAQERASAAQEHASAAQEHASAAQERAFEAQTRFQTALLEVLGRSF